MPLDRPLALRAGALGAAAGVVAVLGQFLPVLLDASTPDRAGPLAFLVSAAGLVVSPVLVLVLGYRTGRRRDVADEYGAVALSLAVGGAAGYVLGYVVAVVALPEGGVAEFAVLLAGSAVYNAVVKGGWFAIAGLAGASVGYFRATRGEPASTGG